MNSAGVSSGEETWSGFSESEAGHHVEDSFDDIGFTDISPDDNPGSCEQNKCELDSDCESDSELGHDVDEINLNPRLEVKRQCELPVRQIHKTDIVGSLTRYCSIGSSAI